MKSLTSLFLVAVLFVSTSFIIREKEENLNPEFLIIQNNECFANFLLNLKKMEALVFIPEDKIEQAKTYNLVPMNLKKAKRANIKFMKAYKKLQMIKPTQNSAEECSELVNYSFGDLEMKVFVRKNANLDMGNDVSVTPVPLPMPKPELKANIQDLAVKVERNAAASGLPTGKRQHKPVRISKELEVRKNEGELTGKAHYGTSNVGLNNESFIGFEEESIWKFFVPIEIK